MGHLFNIAVKTTIYLSRFINNLNDVSQENTTFAALELILRSKEMTS